MSTVLRASGVNFDVDAFIALSKLQALEVHNRGMLKFPTSKPNGPKLETSSIYILVSKADFDDFPGQIADAIKFLSTQAKEIRKLCKFPGVEEVTLDFGIEHRDVLAQYDHFPPELVRLAGALGLGLELSQYPIRKPVRTPKKKPAAKRR